ncbi:MAG: DUF4202 domain-containing protein [Gammaproteobacteria bacterium]|nr:DUF4202 domain-containing protein [Gammaproteobacteria bacterium]
MVETAVLDKSVVALNAAHDQDPERRHHDGRQQAVERVWCDTVALWVNRLVPEASVALKLAAHAQHLERWTDPRSDWPAGRAGYLRWRKSQQRRHAQRAQEILAAAGCERALIERVQQLIRKERLTADPEAATLEDAACLAFLELDLEAFAERHERADVLRILRKTWVKMSPRGQEAALALKLPAASAALIEEALAGE